MKNLFALSIVTFLIISISSFNYYNPTLKKKKLKINITTMGNVKKNDIDLVSSELIKFYNADVFLLPTTELIKDSKVNNLNKYNASKLLNKLEDFYPNTDGKILMLTNHDICTDRTLNGVTHKNWGIFGMAKLGRKPCVVSTCRMGRNYKDRLIKVSIHETGHSLGITHCKNPKCVMTDAKGKGSTVDNASIWMCDVCKSKIKY